MPTIKSRILLVEDEENLRDAIKLNLEMEGYEIEVADTGTKALKMINQQRFNLVILDVMLPEMDGFAVCQKLRINDSTTPVLFLTAKDNSQDKVDGFKIGADDYMTKPFNLEELLLRVKVLVRHSIRSKRETEKLEVFKFGKNEVNFLTYNAQLADGTVLRLTKREIAVLKLLFDRKDSVVSRSQILQHAWEYDIFPSTRTVDNFITNFRKYFEKDPSDPKYFQSIRGIGYRFNYATLKKGED